MQQVSRAWAQGRKREGLEGGWRCEGKEAGERGEGSLDEMKRCGETTTSRGRNSSGKVFCEACGLEGGGGAGSQAGEPVTVRLFVLLLLW